MENQLAIWNEESRKSFTDVEKSEEYFNLSPREDEGNIGTMYCISNKYNLGDSHTLNQEEIIELTKSVPHLPLFIYAHSGISMNTYKQCQWDSSMVGFIIYDQKKATALDLHLSEEQIYKNLQQEIDEYSNYLSY
jgi:hypothetical protein